MPTWSYLGKGAYNKVYICHETKLKLIEGSDYGGPWVLKKPIKSGDNVEDALNDTDRAIRIWKTINPNLPVKKHEQGWIVPYLGVSASSDDERQLTILDIYRRTGRIIADGGRDDNFLNDEQKKATCIDVDAALLRSSADSKKYWSRYEYEYDGFWKRQTSLNINVNSVSTIQDLFYLEKCLTMTEDLRLSLNFEALKFIHQHRINQTDITREQLLSYCSKFPAEIGLSNDIDSVSAPNPKRCYEQHLDSLSNAQRWIEELGRYAEECGKINTSSSFHSKSLKSQVSVVDLAFLPILIERLSGKPVPLMEHFSTLSEAMIYTLSTMINQSWLLEAISLKDCFTYYDEQLGIEAAATVSLNQVIC